MFDFFFFFKAASNKKLVRVVWHFLGFGKKSNFTPFVRKFAYSPESQESTGSSNRLCRERERFFSQSSSARSKKEKKKRQTSRGRGGKGQRTVQGRVRRGVRKDRISAGVEQRPPSSPSAEKLTHCTRS